MQMDNAPMISMPKRLSVRVMQGGLGLNVETVRS